MGAECSCSVDDKAGRSPNSDLSPSTGRASVLTLAGFLLLSTLLLLALAGKVPGNVLPPISVSISSPTHPDPESWYANSEPFLTWAYQTAPGGTVPGMLERMPAANDGVEVLPVYVEDDGKTAWGRGASENYRFRLYRSTDGESWSFVKNLGYPNTIHGIQVTAAGTILLSTSLNLGAGDPNDNILWRSTDGGASFHEVMRLPRGGGRSWNFDRNDGYIVIGTYGYKDSAGNTDRGVWKSVDDGVTWTPIFFLKADGTYDYRNTHVHMARIDPDGGCWIAIGDSGGFVGLYHSSGEPMPLAGGTSVTDQGDFRLVYSQAVARPITVLFDNPEGAARYGFFGEDGMRDRSITRIRYDAVRFVTDTASDRFTTGENHGLLDGDILRVSTTGSLPTGLSANRDYHVVDSTLDSFQLSAASGGPPLDITGAGSGTHSFNYARRVAADFAAQKLNVITGMTKLTDSCWVALAASDGISSMGMLVSHDSGQSWKIDGGWDWDAARFQEIARKPHEGSGGKSYILGGGSAGFKYLPAMPAPEAGAAGYSFVIDQTDDTLPDELIDADHAEKSFTGLADGEWYFHVRAVDDQGNWSDVDHYRIRIDTSGPEIENIMGKITPAGGMVINAIISDAASGVDWENASVFLDGSEVTGKCSRSGSIISCTIDAVAAEAHAVKISAADKAGNVNAVEAIVPVCAGAPVLDLSGASGYWSSMADYQNRILSVDHKISNSGSHDSFDVTIRAAIATNAVIAYPEYPPSADIAAGEAISLTIRYVVPHGVESFRTTAYATASDACNSSYAYPGAFPAS